MTHGRSLRTHAMRTPAQFMRLVWAILFCCLAEHARVGHGTLLPVAIGHSSANAAAALSDKDSLLAFKAHFTEDPTDLHHLNLTGNRFSGALPGYISLFSRLRLLDLSSNLFTGPIPDSLPQIFRLLYLDLSHNGFSGPIPPQIGQLSNLTTLLLSSNALSDVIPSLDNLTRLTALDLSQNNLSGVIPATGKLGSFPETSFAGNPALCYHFCPAPQPTASPSPSASPSPPQLLILDDSAARTLTPGAIVAVVVCAVGGVILVLAAASICCAGILDGATSAPRHGKQTPPQQTSVTMFDSNPIRVADLLEAVENFQEASLVEVDMWGSLHKALFANRSVLGVKKLKCSGQDNPAMAEFTTIGERFGSGMLAIPPSCTHTLPPVPCLPPVSSRSPPLSTLRHKHILPLVGQWEHDSCPVLLYEWMPHGNLKEFLSSEDPTSPRSRQWISRYKIALGIARGLSFLHHSSTPPIVCGDLHPGNVRLGREYEPKIADVSVCAMMSREGLVTPSEEGREYADPVFDNVNGTLTKSDVYTFGVILLEILTGQPPREMRSGSGRGLEPLHWIRGHMQAARLREVLDPKMDVEEYKDEIAQVLKIAMTCLAGDPAARPPMNDVVEMLVRAQENAEKIKNDPLLRDILL